MAQATKIGAGAMVLFSAAFFVVAAHGNVDDPDVFAPPSRSLVAGEARHYRLVTLPIPPDIVMEVGGLAFRPDGKLLCCTRRGEVWLISNPLSEDLSRIRYKLFATSLHEPLGLVVDGAHSVYVVQRPE